MSSQGFLVLPDPSFWFVTVHHGNIVCLIAYTYSTPKSRYLSASRKLLSSWILTRICLLSIVKLQKEARIAHCQNRQTKQSSLLFTHGFQYHGEGVCQEYLKRIPFYEYCQDNTAAGFCSWAGLNKGKQAGCCKKKSSEDMRWTKALSGLQGTDFSESSKCQGGWRQGLALKQAGC